MCVCECVLMCGQGSQAAVAWLNENGPSVHMVEAANMCGSKETEKQQSSPNCEKKRKSWSEMFCGQSPGVYGRAWEDRGCQEGRVSHEPRGTCPGLEQERPFPEAKGWRREEAVGSQGWKVGFLDKHPQKWRGVQKWGRLWAD